MLAADGTEVARQRQRDAPRGREEPLEARRVPSRHSHGQYSRAIGGAAAIFNMAVLTTAILTMAIPLQHLLVPLVPQLRLLERAKLAKGLEGVLVRRELPAAEPRYHLLACLGAERVDHEARAW